MTGGVKKQNPPSKAPPAKRPPIPPAQPLPLPYEHVDAANFPTPAWQEALRILEPIHAQLRADYPEKSLPPIRVMTQIMSNSPHEIDGRSPLYFLGDKDLAVGIYFFPDQIAKLSAKEIVAAALHEYAHHYLDHIPKKLEAKSKVDAGTMAPRDYMAYLRSLECEADHFAGYYYRFATQAMSTMLPSLSGEPLETPTQLNRTHPGIADRVRMLQETSSTRIKPGLVKFDGTCQAIELGRLFQFPEGLRKALEGPERE